MMLLPLGKERGVAQGTVFTVWKDKREAARIRVQSSRDGFLLVYILAKIWRTAKTTTRGFNLHYPRTRAKSLGKCILLLVSNKNFHYIHMPIIIEWLFPTASPDDDTACSRAASELGIQPARWF